jgi:signal transduction histidine kinase/DNA-binding NarL/FixJ family response regulator
MTSKKILLVDDQEFALKILRDILGSDGFLIEEARDGETACRKAVEFQPDIILMDMVMPGMDGVEACRRIKQGSRTADIPVIVITANKDKEKLFAAFEAGADDYLNKPFAGRELQSRINSNLVKRAALTLLKHKARDSEILLEILQAITSTLKTEEILQIIVKKIAANMLVNRCSIARIKEDDRYGYVLASSDDPEVNSLRIDLGRYPEIREVIRTGKTLILDDVKNHPLMNEVRPHIAGLDFDTIMVLPVIYRSEVIGTLMLRTARGKQSFTARELDFCRLVANVAAGPLRNAHHYEMILEETGELQEANERLKEINRFKTEFISTASHELRIPMMIFHSYCSLIRDMGDDNLTEKQREYLHTAIESSGRMVDLIDDMLDLAKLESGKANLNFEKKDVMEPIREACSLLAPFASINGLEISIDPLPTGAHAYFDSDKIRGVLTNIIDNAIKFTPSGGRIDIAVTHDGDFVLVSVSDTGCGIPENQISFIFDEFAQLRSHAGPKRGSGLGLAICKRIIDAHKGRIWAASTPRQGSKFTFSLPLAHTSDS